MREKIRVIDCHDVSELPETPNGEELNVAYRLLPNNPSDEYYNERTDRNIGWITSGEQYMLKQAVIGIAGCGGMGAQAAEKFLRLGVGEIRIADRECFDVSNINRQLGATRTTVGKSKVFETARLLRSISDDSTIVVYPGGINQQTADDFIRGCHVICDEIEFWCVSSRIALHQSARSIGVPTFVCNSIGFGSHVFLFTPNGTTMEECLGMNYEEAEPLEQKILERKACALEVMRVMDAVVRGLFPAWTEYHASNARWPGKVALRERLMHEQRGAIIATNPPLACGFLADRVLLHLLQNSLVKRSVTAMPEMPGYLYLDAAVVQAKTVIGKWW